MWISTVTIASATHHLNADDNEPAGKKTVMYAAMAYDWMFRKCFMEDA